MTEQNNERRDLMLLARHVKYVSPDPREAARGAGERRLAHNFELMHQEWNSRWLPPIRIRDPKTFCVFGSAEKYYKDSFNYIRMSYPYDGSRLERLKWFLSASVVDLAVFQHEYPMSTGYVNFTGNNNWGVTRATSGDYGLSDNVEYIKFNGQSDSKIAGSLEIFEDSLRIKPKGGPNSNAEGNTIEFWLKKKRFQSEKTGKEVVLDVYTPYHNELTPASGRVTVELDQSSPTGWVFTYMSGTVGANQINIDDHGLLEQGDPLIPMITTPDGITDNEWHHYAFAVIQEPIPGDTRGNLSIEYYKDGIHVSNTTVVCDLMDAHSASFAATLGALGTTKNGTGGLGYGKLEGSIDEFRFWKTRRTGEEINLMFDLPVHGVTPAEHAHGNAGEKVLGIYYKFNEGVTERHHDDKVVLDYSGTVNNGEIVNYRNYMRSTGSAISQADSSITRIVEFGDPIMNNLSKNYRLKLEHLALTGSNYDKVNHASVFKNIPQWAYEDPEGSSNIDSNFSILLQAMAQQFDGMKLQADRIAEVASTTIEDFVHASGELNHLDMNKDLLGCSMDVKEDLRGLSVSDKFAVANLLGKGFQVDIMPLVNEAQLYEYYFSAGLISKGNQVTTS